MTKKSHVEKPHHKALKDALVGLTQTGQDFLNDHPLYGLDTDYPLAAAAVKELAKKVSDGTISEDLAYEKAAETLDKEMADRESRGLNNDRLFTASIGMDVAAE